MTQYDYLSKLSSVVENKTKSKSAEKNKIKNSRQPLITRTIHIKEMIKQNLKNSNLITGGSSTGKLYETFVKNIIH